MTTTIPETTLAYCAGLFDGEGNITLSRHYTNVGRRPMSYGKHPPYRYRLSIVVNQVRHEAVVLFHSLWGGQIRYLQRNRKHATSPTTGKAFSSRWWWELNDGRALEALTQMEPYLRLKNAEVELARRFQATKLWNGRSFKLGRTPAEIAFQEWCFEEMKRLKHLHDLPSTHESNLALIQSFRQVPHPYTSSRAWSYASTVGSDERPRQPTSEQSVSSLTHLKY